MRKKELYARIVELEAQNYKVRRLVTTTEQYGPSQSDFDAVVKTANALDAELVETKKKLEELTAMVADLTAENTRLQHDMHEMMEKAFEIITLGGGLANL